MISASQKTSQPNAIMTRFDPERDDDLPPMDAAFMVGMTPSRRGRPNVEAPNAEGKLRRDGKTQARQRTDDPE